MNQQDGHWCYCNNGHQHEWALCLMDGNNHRHDRALCWNDGMGGLQILVPPPLSLLDHSPGGHHHCHDDNHCDCGLGVRPLHPTDGI
jgi:hypothetical protein